MDNEEDVEQEMSKLLNSDGVLGGKNLSNALKNIRDTNVEDAD